MPSVATGIRIPVPTGGVRADLSARQVGPTNLADAENWVRRLGELQVRPGFGTFATNVAQRPSGYVRYEHDDLAIRLVKGTVSGWWRFNEGTSAWVDITQGGNTLTGSPANQQVFRVFTKAGQSWLLGVNDKDAPKKWDGLAATYLDIGGTPPKAKCMAVSLDRVILGNLSSGGTISPVAVDVSNNKDFDTGWGSVLVALLADTPGSIVTMGEMGNLQAAIYKTDAVYMAYGQSTLVPFRFEMKQTGFRGPASPRSLAVLSDGFHVFLSEDGGVNTFDGVTVRSLGPHIHKRIAETMNPNTIGRSWITFDPARNELWVVYPEKLAVDPNIGVIVAFPGLEVYPIRWSTLRPSAGIESLLPTGITIGELVGTIGQQEATIGEYSGQVDRVLIGDKGGQSFIDTALADNAAAIAAFFETGLSDLGDPRRWKTVEEIDHMFEKAAAPQNVSVKLGTSDYGETPVLSAAETVDVGADGPYLTGHRLTARLFSFRVEAQATQKVLWSGSEAAVNTRGLR